MSNYKKTEEYDLVNTEKLSGYYHDIITHIGEDPSREGLMKTPERAAKMIQFLTHGQCLHPATSAP